MGDRITGLPFATRSEVLATHGMAATSQPLATQIALDVLKLGGSAVDAAIAANAALGLMEPTGAGVGGDLFAIVWDAKAGRLVGFNGSGRSPQGLPFAYFAEHGLARIPSRGPLPVSVPGTVDGWFELHARFGRRSLADDLAPAIRYAARGFPGHRGASRTTGARNVPAARRQVPGLPRDLRSDGGEAPAKGEIFAQPGPRAARSSGSPRAGAMPSTRADRATRSTTFCARRAASCVRSTWRRITSTWVEPVHVNYRGYDVWELPPNGQGIAALQMLEHPRGLRPACDGLRLAPTRST